MVFTILSGERTSRVSASAAAFLLLGSGLATAQEPSYDDPAVAICELVLKDSLPREAAFRRLSAKVEGFNAIISYEFSVLNTRPKIQEHTCRFTKNDEGLFHLIRLNPARTDCNVEVAAFQATQNWRAPSSFQEAERARNDLRRCNAQLERDEQAASEIASRELPLLETGIYPIAPQDTELAVE